MASSPVKEMKQAPDIQIAAVAMPLAIGPTPRSAR